MTPAASGGIPDRVRGGTTQAVVETSPIQEQRSGITDFVGRESELAEIARLLERARLVTVAGPGGVGKTRVALAAAAAAADAFADGAWIVELSGLRDPALLSNTVASVLRLPEQSPESQLVSILDYLRDRRMLLILDTCEHMIDACASLAERIVQSAPCVCLLTTSRQPLDIPGEYLYTVQPLPVPRPGTTVPHEPVAAGDGGAVELFALRAASAVPGFEVTTANWPDVIRLCRRLDGIPLAIELAAVRLRTMPLNELVRHLNQTFKILATGDEGPLGRHVTLRTAIEWSHHLCSPAERRLWARLSVFAGTFDLGAVEEVCAETELERDDVLRALVGLVDKSVVLRDDGDESRYWLLDSLREFGAEQLAAGGEVTACRDRHLARYVRIAREFAGHFTGDGQLKQYHQLRREHASIRAALEHALGSQDGAFGKQCYPGGTTPRNPPAERGFDGADLASGLYGYWHISGLLQEGAYWLTKVLDRFPEPCAAQARALVNRGSMRSFAGQLPGALADCRAGTGMALELGEQAIAARGYLHLGLALTFTGLHAEAAATLDEARRRLTECDDRIGLQMLMPQLAHLHQLSGDLDAAIAVCEQGLEMFGEGSAERWVQSYIHNVAGVALFQQPGREAECEATVLRGLALKQELGDLIGTAYALETLGWLSARTGSCERTAWALGAASPLWERGGGSRFSGTAIMESFHQQAMRTARSVLGGERYLELHATGARQMKEQLDSVAASGPLALRVP
jgi:non-specific serine/threonine protein kinase